LREWRRKRAQADGVPAYVVFHDRTLQEIAERRCTDWADLAAVSGVGPAKLERYADEILAIVASG
jgi:superfamily II DNA helicase RecQ